MIDLCGVVTSGGGVGCHLSSIMSCWPRIALKNDRLEFIIFEDITNIYLINFGIKTPLWPGFCIRQPVHRSLGCSEDTRVKTEVVVGASHRF